MNVTYIDDELDEVFSKSVVTLGNFDGVHRGHQKLLELTRLQAERLDAHSVVITFDPHPVELFKPEIFQKIQLLPEKLASIEKSGVDNCVVMAFNRRLANYSPRDFVEQFLVQRFGLKHIFIGYDTTFGKQRAGDPEMMKRLGLEFGFETTIVPAVLHEEQPISSSRIRRSVLVGDVEEAGELLGHPFQIGGEVVRGFGCGGSLLGFPTANLNTGRRLTPKKGVYAVRVRLGEECYSGALSVGTNPTFGQQELSVEVHILDFDRDIYGEQLTLEFVRRMRDEKRFDGVEALKAQLRRDIEATRHVLL